MCATLATSPQHRVPLRRFAPLLPAFLIAPLALSVRYTADFGLAYRGGLEAWAASGRELRTFETAEVEDMATWILSSEPTTVIDARDENEWVHGHVPGAVHLPVASIEHHAHEIPHEAPVAVHCASGYRAGIAASLLEQAGLKRIIHVNGPYSDWDRLHLAETVP